MDTLDARIIQQLSHPDQGYQWDVRVSFAEVGRALHVDAETVRSRVARMEADGVLSRWRVGVNPSLLGREVARIEIVAAPDAAEVERRIAALRAMDGPYSVFEDQVGGLGVVLFHPSGSLPRYLTLLETLSGAPVSSAPGAIPAANIEMEPGDWRLVQALRRDPRRPLEALASEVGVSTRTLRRWLDRLTHGKALMLAPQLEAERARGLFPAEARVMRDASAAPTRGLLADVPRTIFLHEDRHMSRVSFLAESMAEVDALRRRLQELPDVTHAQVRFFVRRIFVDAWLDEEIARRAAVA